MRTPRKPRKPPPGMMYRPVYDDRRWLEWMSRPPAPRQRPKRRTPKTERHLAAIRAVYQPGMSVDEVIARIKVVNPTSKFLDLQPSRQYQLVAIVAADFATKA
jgi:hypothetical protein